MRFDRSLRDRWSSSANGWHFDLPSGWRQGRSVYGGLTVAAAASLALRQVAGLRSLRALTAQLVRPVSPGVLHGSLRIIREGKTLSFVEVGLLQQEREVAAVSMAFAAPRAGSLPIAPSARFQGPEPESLVDIPYVAGVTPECTQHLALRWASGGVPFSGSAQARLSGYCRFRVPAGDVEGIIGLLDAFPSPSLSVLRAPAPSSTVTWTAHIFDVPAELDDWFAFRYETIAGRSGFHTVAGHLYAPDGQLVAWSEQLVAIFD